MVEAVLHEGEGGGYAGEAAGRRAVGPVIVGAPPLLPQSLPLPGHRVQLGVDLVHDVSLLQPRVNIQQNCLWICVKNRDLSGQFTANIFSPINFDAVVEKLII